jgi:hypothetical protein
MDLFKFKLKEYIVAIYSTLIDTDVYSQSVLQTCMANHRDTLFSKLVSSNDEIAQNYKNILNLSIDKLMEKDESEWILLLWSLLNFNDDLYFRFKKISPFVEKNIIFSKFNNFHSLDLKKTSELSGYVIDGIYIKTV